MRRPAPTGGGYLLSRFRSTIGVVRLNFSVRDGKRWDPDAIAASVRVRRAGPGGAPRACASEGARKPGAPLAPRHRGPALPVSFRTAAGMSFRLAAPHDRISRGPASPCRLHRDRAARLSCLRPAPGVCRLPAGFPSGAFRCSFSGLAARKGFGRLVPLGCARRRACTCGLSTSSSSTALKRRSYLGVGFALRCLQRLSWPDAATRRCPWRDSRRTGGPSDTVLSY